MDHHNHLVSVVVPVYKTEKYLDRCVTSIVNQTYENLEIILVDDGSPDLCPEMCDQWAEWDTRIKVIHKKNAGLGMARNTGIEIATGAYICFFDSDDYVEHDTIEKALRTAERETAEVVLFGNYRLGRDGGIVKRNVPQSPKTCYQGAEVQTILLPDMVDNRHSSAQVRGICLSACMCMISMELVGRTGWRFVSEREIISEDSYSLLQIFSHIQCAAILSEALYYHCENEVSLTQVYREDRHLRNRQFFLACKALLEEKTYCIQTKQSVAGLYLSLTIAAMKQLIASNLRNTDKVRHVKEILSDETVQEALVSVKTRHYGRMRRILVWAMERKKALMCMLLILAKDRAEHK